MAKTDKNTGGVTNLRLQELEKCKQDPIYFIKNYIFIQHPVKGRISLDLYPFQENCISDFLDYKYNVIVKSRQLGLSTITSAYCLWLAMFDEDKEIRLMATRLETAKNMIQKIRIAFKDVPAWIKASLGLTETEKESVKYIEFTNGSKIEAIPTTPESVRGVACSLLIIDECAHIEKFDEIWEAARPTITTGGDAILFSSPNSKNMFYEIYKNAETGDWAEGKVGFHGATTGKNGFHAVKLPWQVHPDRDDEWFENESKSMDAKKIDKEFCCGFEGSGNTYFVADTIESIKKSVSTPISYQEKNNLWIWAEPDVTHKYLLVCDIARGDGEDNSSCHIIDTTIDEEVAEFYGKIPPDDFGELLARYGEMYNYGQIINELNSIGIATSIKLRDLKYPNLFYMPKIMDNWHLMDDEEKSKALPGYTTTSKERERLLSKLENVLRNNLLKINSSRFASELDTFIWNGKKAQSLRGKNDDSIMALSLSMLVYEPSGMSKNRKGEDQMSWHDAFLRSVAGGKVSSNVSKVKMLEQEKLQMEMTGGKYTTNPLIPRRGGQSFGFFGLDPSKIIK